MNHVDSDIIHSYACLKLKCTRPRWFMNMELFQDQFPKDLNDVWSESCLRHVPYTVMALFWWPVPELNVHALIIYKTNGRLPGSFASSDCSCFIKKYHQMLSALNSNKNAREHPLLTPDMVLALWSRQWFTTGSLLLRVERKSLYSVSVLLPK